MVCPDFSDYIRSDVTGIKEYPAALTVLTDWHYPINAWDSDYEVKTAKRFESRFPEEILEYYISGLGNMKSNDVRKEYARKAKLTSKIRRILVEILRDNGRWQVFARNIKQDNIRRPAFQEEFTKVLPDWSKF